MSRDWHNTLPNKPDRSEDRHSTLPGAIVRTAQPAHQQTHMDQKNDCLFIDGLEPDYPPSHGAATGTVFHGVAVQRPPRVVEATHRNVRDGDEDLTVDQKQEERRRCVSCLGMRPPLESLFASANSGKRSICRSPRPCGPLRAPQVQCSWLKNSKQHT